MAAFLISVVVVVILTGIDQAVKVWAIENLKGQADRTFLKLGSFDWMHLRYIENRGAAFSMMTGFRGFLIAFPLIMICVCFYILHRKGKAHRYLYLAMPLIAAGGLGNLIDRIFRGGAVVDYLDFQLCNFAVFNFADVCVTVGVAVLMFGILFLEHELPEAKKQKNAERLPYARYAPDLPEAGELEEADELPAAGEYPAAELLKDAETLTEETDHAAE